MQLKAKADPLQVITWTKESHTKFLSPQDKNSALLFLFFVLCFFPPNITHRSHQSCTGCGVFSIRIQVFFFDKSIRIQVCVPTFAFRHILNLQCCCFDPFSLIFCLLWRLLRIAFVEVAMTTMYRINTFNMGKENGTDSLI